MLGVLHLPPTYGHVEELALQGNELFKEGDFGGAIELYSEAIKIDPQNAMEQNHLYHANRAACHQKLKVQQHVLQQARFRTLLRFLSACPTASAVADILDL